MAFLSHDMARQCGQRIAALRQRQGLTLEALATRAELSPHLVRLIEDGDYDLPVSTLAALARALSVRPDLLLLDESTSERRLILDSAIERAMRSGISSACVAQTILALGAQGGWRPLTAEPVSPQ